MASRLKSLPQRIRTNEKIQTPCSQQMSNLKFRSWTKEREGGIERYHLVTTTQGLANCIREIKSSDGIPLECRSELR